MNRLWKTRPGGPPPPEPAAFQGRRLAVWLPIAALLGAVVAWGAMAAQEYFAPLVIFPLAAGVGLGALLVLAMRVGDFGHRLTVLAGLAVAIGVAVVGQHYIGYRAETRRARTDLEKFLLAQTLFDELSEERRPVPPSDFVGYMHWQAARGRPLNIRGYVARGGMAWLSWMIDAALLAAAAVATVVPALRQPYCNRCRSWLCTTRSGRLSPGAGKSLGKLAGVSLPEEPSWVRYRLVNCASGCAPTGLMLFWETSDEADGARIWLNPELRDRITRFLDQPREADSEG